MDIKFGLKLLFGHGDGDDDDGALSGDFDLAILKKMEVGDQPSAILVEG